MNFFSRNFLDKGRSSEPHRGEPLRGEAAGADATPFDPARFETGKARPLNAARPSGAEHEVALDDLFFSTTDARGVIDEANAVFCRMSRYPRNRLMGAPHSIIRHPAMPGGAFKLVWDLLLAGKPACAYVLNLAADGSAYWAFATIVPIGERLLSVRQRPCHSQLMGSVAVVYEEALLEERKARSGDMRQSKVASVGAACIGKALGDLGYASYEDFQLDLVPLELAARRELSPTPAGTAVSDPLHVSIVSCSSEVETQLAELTDAMSAAQDVTTRLSAASKAIIETMRRLAEVLSGARVVCEDWPNQDELVVTALPAVLDKCAHLQGALGPIEAEVNAVVHTRRQFRFDVELARLQNEAIGRYVVGVASGAEDPKISCKAITSLSNALYALVNTDLAHDIEATSQLRGEVNTVAAALRVLNMVVGTWRRLVDTRGMAEVLQDAMPVLDKALKRMGREVTEISESVGLLVSAIEGFDVDLLKDRLTRIASESERF
ncbi:MAG: hypothetical protein KGN34_13510 [Sphingomonadales bacterium]|nr:hypothetical protein [Sphingomonadales bacterium]